MFESIFDTFCIASSYRSSTKSDKVFLAFQFNYSQSYFTSKYSDCSCNMRDPLQITPDPFAKTYSFTSI